MVMFLCCKSLCFLEMWKRQPSESIDCVFYGWEFQFTYIYVTIFSKMNLSFDIIILGIEFMMFLFLMIIGSINNLIIAYTSTTIRWALFLFGCFVGCFLPLEISFMLYSLTLMLRIVQAHKSQAAYSICKINQMIYLLNILFIMLLKVCPLGLMEE